MLDSTFEHLPCGPALELEFDSNREPGLAPALTGPAQFLTIAARSRRDKLAGEALPPTEAATYPDPELRLALRDVERAFKRLPESQRSAAVERTTG